MAGFNPPLNPLPNTHNQIHQFPPQNPQIYTTYEHKYNPLHYSSSQLHPQNSSINHHQFNHQPHSYSYIGLSEYEQSLRDEVIYLHSLWRRGPPSQSQTQPQNPHLKPSPTIPFKKKKKQNKKPSEALKTQIISDKEWPIEPKPTSPSTQGTGWAEFKARPAPNTRPATAEEQAKVLALRVQLKGLDSFIGLFKGPYGDSSDDDDDEDDYADDCDEEFEFFMKVFEGDNELRGYYERNCENGEFYCLVCGVIGNKLGRVYKNCVALVQHSVSISKTKKRKAHRAYGQVVCKVLGWDINRLPSMPCPSNGDASAQSLEKSNGLQDEVNNHADDGEQNPNIAKMEGDSVNTGDRQAEPKDVSNDVDNGNVGSMDESCNANELLLSERGEKGNADGCGDNEHCSFIEDRICTSAEAVQSEQENTHAAVQSELENTHGGIQSEQENTHAAVHMEFVNKMSKECSAVVSNSTFSVADDVNKHVEGVDQIVSDSGMKV